MTSPLNTGLELVGVSVDYGPTRAVDSVSLELPAGQVMAILGPSGCGKSTLLRCVAGLEPLASGMVTWQGTDLAGVPVHRRGIGLMFQQHALFPHRNVADNVAFGLRMAKLPPAQISSRVDELLALVDLDGFGDRTVGTLSGGQAQRVALARALAPSPKLLLLDEPLGSLDRALRDHLVHQVRAIVTSLGITALHVTHDHDEAVSVADHLALLDRGRLVRTGRVADLLATPGDVATAAALGVDNVISARVGPGGEMATPFGPATIDAPNGSQGHLLLRPSAVAIADAGPSATVTGSRFRGNTWLLSCQLESGESVIVEHPDRLADHAQVRLLADLASVIPLSAPPQDR